MAGDPDTDFSRLGDLMGEALGGPRPQAEPAPAATRGRRSPAPSRSPGRAGTSAGGDDVVGRLALAWEAVVGPEVAANSQPVRFSRGRLVVAASSSAWAQTLHFMENAITRGLNERLGQQVVESVLFRPAGWDRFSATAGQEAGVAPSGQTADTGSGAAAAAPATGLGSQSTSPGAELTPEQAAALEAVAHLGLAPRLERDIMRAMTAVFVRGQRDSVR